MKNNNVLIVGNCVVDQIMVLPHYPHQDEELLAEEKTMAIGGNACNSSRILAELGHQVSLVSSLARDSEAQWLLEQLSDAGINTEYCRQHPAYATPVSSIWLNQQNGSRTIVHYRNLPELALQDLQKIRAGQYQWIHFEGRNIETLRHYLPALMDSAIPVSLEIEKNREQIEQLLPYVNTVIVSSQYLSNRKLSAKDCLQALKRYNRCLNIVCTLGSSGLIAMDENNELYEIEAEPIEHVIDTIGAGDCFIAGLIDHLMEKKSFPSALRFANRLAARKIQYRGMTINEKQCINLPS